MGGVCLRPFSSSLYNAKERTCLYALRLICLNCIETSVSLQLQLVGRALVVRLHVLLANEW